MDYTELLPDDLLGHVFSFVADYKTRSECSLVSRRWCYVSTNFSPIPGTLLLGNNLPNSIKATNSPRTTVSLQACTNFPQLENIYTQFDEWAAAWGRVVTNVSIRLTHPPVISPPNYATNAYAQPSPVHVGSETHNVAKLITLHLKRAKVVLIDGFEESLEDLFAFFGSRFVSFTIANSPHIYGVEHCANLVHVSLVGIREMTDLYPLLPCQKLEVVEVEGCANLEDVGTLAGLPALRKVRVGKCPLVTDLAQLCACEGLEEVDLPGSRFYTLEGIRNWSSMTSLNLEDCRPLDDISALMSAAANQLRVLNLRECRNIRDISAIAACTNLKILQFNDNSLVRSLDPLSSCVRLNAIELIYMHEIDDLTPLTRCVNLQNIEIRNCACVTSLDPLSLCPKLRAVSVIRCRGIRDVSPLGRCRELTSVDIGECRYVRDINALSSCVKLRSLNLVCSGVKDVSALSTCTGLTNLNLRWDVETMSTAFTTGLIAGTVWAYPDPNTVQVRSLLQSAAESTNNYWEDNTAFFPKVQRSFDTATACRSLAPISIPDKWCRDNKCSKATLDSVCELNASGKKDPSKMCGSVMANIPDSWCQATTCDSRYSAMCQWKCSA